MQHLRIRFYIGLGTTPGMTADEAARHATGKIVGQYDGGTFTRSTGAWRGSEGLVEEESLVAEVLTIAAGMSLEIHRDVAQSVALELADMLVQDSVLFTLETLDHVEFAG